MNDKVKQEVRESASQSTFKIEQKQSEQKKKTGDNEKVNNKEKDGKQSIWNKLKTKFNNVFKKNKKESKKESMHSGDKTKNLKMAELINSKRMSKAGNSVEKLGENNQKAKSSVLLQSQARQVQIYSDVYHVLETYARVSAMEEISGISGFSYNGMDKSKSLDVLKKANPEELKNAVGEFKANSEKNPVGNVDFSARVVSVAEKLPEQLASEQKNNGAKMQMNVATMRDFRANTTKR